MEVNNYINMKLQFNQNIKDFEGNDYVLNTGNTSVHITFKELVVQNLMLDKSSELSLDEKLFKANLAEKIYNADGPIELKDSEVKHMLHFVGQTASTAMVYELKKFIDGDEKYVENGVS